MHHKMKDDGDGYTAYSRLAVQETYCKVQALGLIAAQDVQGGFEKMLACIHFSHASGAVLKGKPSVASYLRVCMCA